MNLVANEAHFPDTSRVHPQLRVVAIVPGDDFSGPGGQVASSAVRLADHGVDVRFVLLTDPVSPTGRLPAFFERRGIVYRTLDDHGPLDVRLALELRGVLKEWRPDIVETHGYKASALAWILRRRTRSAWVGFFHGFTAESRRAHLYHRLDHWLLGKADRAVVITEEQRAMLARRAPNARVIYSAVTTLDDDSDPGEERRMSELFADAPRPRIGVAGRLSPEKGADVFIAAASLLKQQGITFSGLIAGDGPERSRLEAMIADHGLRESVRLAGRVSDMKVFYRGLDLLVIPSRSEGLPSVLLEGLACGVDVVATRVGAIPEVLTDPDVGLVVPREDPAALANAIADRLTNPGDAGARENAVLRFSQERRVRELLDLYREVRPSSRPWSRGV